MKVLTVKTLEVIAPEIQRDIHYTLRMEHQAEHIFRDKNADRYSSTISMKETEDTINSIIKNSADIPEYTLLIDDLDMENNRFERLIIKQGQILEKKSGTMTWEK